MCSGVKAQRAQWLSLANPTQSGKVPTPKQILTEQKQPIFQADVRRPVQWDEALRPKQVLTEQKKRSHSKEARWPAQGDEALMPKKVAADLEDRNLEAVAFVHQDRKPQKRKATLILCLPVRWT